jgi:predicted  nucleic acid-binding Zn-ribbon protein
MRIPVEPAPPVRGGNQMRRAAPSLIGGQPASQNAADALERLTRLRSMLPALGQELADARDEAAQLRIENRKLREQLDRIREDRQTRVANAITITRLNRPSSQRRGSGSPMGRAGASS